MHIVNTAELGALYMVSTGECSLSMFVYKCIQHINSCIMYILFWVTVDCGLAVNSLKVVYLLNSDPTSSH